MSEAGVVRRSRQLCGEVTERLRSHGIELVPFLTVGCLVAGFWCALSIPAIVEATGLRAEPARTSALVHAEARPAGDAVSRDREQRRSDDARAVAVAVVERPDEGLARTGRDAGAGDALHRSPLDHSRPRLELESLSGSCVPTQTGDGPYAVSGRWLGQRSRCGRSSDGEHTTARRRADPFTAGSRRVGAARPCLCSSDRVHPLGRACAARLAAPAGREWLRRQEHCDLAPERAARDRQRLRSDAGSTRGDARARTGCTERVAGSAVADRQPGLACGRPR